jgi:hypothetical protein
LREEGLLGFKWMIFRPRPAPARNAGASNAISLGLAISNDPFQKAVMPEGNSDEHAPASDLE